MKTWRNDTAKERRAHARAVAIAAELDRPLAGVVIEFKEAHELLSDGVSLVEAARFFASHGAPNVEKRDLPDVVEDFIKQLESDGRSERYVEDASSSPGPRSRPGVASVPVLTATGPAAVAEQNPSQFSPPSTLWHTSPAEG